MRMSGETRATPARWAASAARVEEVRLRLRDLRHRKPLNASHVEVARARADDARGRLDVALWQGRQVAAAAGVRPSASAHRSWLEQWPSLEDDAPAAWSDDDYVHECCFVSSTRELLDVAGPPLQRAAARDELIVLGCSEQNNAALSVALGERQVVTLPRPDGLRSAVTMFSRYRDVVRAAARDGPARIRLVVEPSFETGPDGWDEWRRFEGLCNELFTGFAMSHMCVYDVGAVPSAVLATAELSHPYLRADGVRAPNLLYVDPHELRRLSEPVTSAGMGLSPDLVLREVHRPGAAGRRLSALLRERGMGVRAVEDMVTAVGEMTSVMVTAWRGPITIRVWTPPRGVVCALTPEPPVFVDDPDGTRAVELFEGLLRTRLGAQLAKQLCDDVSPVRDFEGFSVRLTKRR